MTILNGVAVIAHINEYLDKRRSNYGRNSFLACIVALVVVTPPLFMVAKLGIVH